MHDSDIARVHGRYDRRRQQLSVAYGREVQVEDDGVVNGQSHQHADQIVLAQVAFLIGTEPVAAWVRMVHEHPVVRVEDLPDQQQKPFLC